MGPPMPFLVRYTVRSLCELPSRFPMRSPCIPRAFPCVLGSCSLTFSSEFHNSSPVGPCNNFPVHSLWDLPSVFLSVTPCVPCALPSAFPCTSPYKFPVHSTRFFLLFTVRFILPSPPHLCVLTYVTRVFYRGFPVSSLRRLPYIHFKSHIRLIVCYTV